MNEHNMPWNLCNQPLKTAFPHTSASRSPDNKLAIEAMNKNSHCS